FEKFPAADPTLTTTMKSVGEAMALGRNFTEALGKALRSIEKSGMQFRWDKSELDEVKANQSELLKRIATPYDTRLIDVQQLLWAARTENAHEQMITDIYAISGLDPWFLRQIDLVNSIALEVAAASSLSKELLTKAKRHGLSDRQIANLRKMGVGGELAIREIRHALGIIPVYKAVDTVAGQLPAKEAYLYSAYEVSAAGQSQPKSEVMPRTKEAVIILGSGPNRIGQGLEFDYSCVHATLALRDQGYEAIMVNCNPETVSTDYDISDRLYFEPLTFEDVYEVYLAELTAGPVKGMIVQLGGQTPLGLADKLAAAGVPILGTSPAAIDAAEDREMFGTVLAKAGLRAPEYGTARTGAEALAVADRIGYPVLVRPSYVLGGRGMEIVYSREQLHGYIERALSEHDDDGATSSTQVFTAPLLIDRFLDNGIEIDVDALYDGEELFLGGVMEHIEEAGIHSGDSACVLPPVSLSAPQIAEIRDATLAIAQAVGVRGLINVQYAIVADQLYVLEANPRASRTVPFVAKATGVQLAGAAAEIMVGKSIAELRAAGQLPETDATAADALAPIAVKEAVLPFRRFRTDSGTTVDTILGPEMRSTGEVMGFDSDFPTAFAKSQSAAYGGLPTGGTAFISVADRHKRSIVFPVKRLADLGFDILATSGTASVLARNGIPAKVVARYGEPGETIVDLIDAGKVDLVVNTPGNKRSREGGYAIRAATTANDKALITTVDSLGAAVQAIEVVRGGPYQVTTIQEHTANTLERRNAG
ncbi:MAG: carbamoyl-phosphate synthase large subunit, partial [Promicromonosporaceae bacterium]|nr:carbamoyl-phosphate synthase large subunit [Promicromonosporaceae bacterium]